MSNKPISELSGLDLRTVYCELRGWRAELDMDGGVLYWHSPACGVSGTHRNDACNYPSHRLDLPPYESDATLSEGELNRVCDEKEWRWQVNACFPDVDEKFCCFIYYSNSDSDDYFGRGSIPSEARMRALCAALGSKK